MEKHSKKKIGVHAAVVAGVAGAMVIGAGGGAVSAALITSAQIKDNTIKSRDIRNATIKGVDVAPNSIPGADLRDGTVTGTDVGNGSLTPADLSQAARTYWAVVNSNGTVARSSGGVSASDQGTGYYEVVFPVDVTQCAYAVSPGGSGSVGSPPHVGVGSLGRSGNSRGLWVETWSEADAPVDASFHVIVDC
jgi:hypothetical protein